MSVVDFDLLVKYLSGNASPEEAIWIEEWRSTSVSNNNYFIEISEEWEKGNLKPFVKANIEEMWKQFPLGKNQENDLNIYTINQKNRRLRLLRITGVAAALLIILLSAGAYFYFSGTSNDRKSYIAQTAPKTFLLPDSSIMNMERGRADYHVGNGNVRTIDLYGNANFDVKHKLGSRFLIRLKCGLTIEDIGTAFSIKEYPDSVLINVTEGKVLASDNNNQLAVNKNELLSYIVASGTFSIEERKRDFNFKDATLEEIAGEISEEYNIEVLLDGNNFKKCKISIFSPGISLSDFLKILEHTIDISYKRTKDTITFYGKGCD